MSGMCMALLLFICLPFAPKLGYDTSAMLAFFGKIAALIPMYFGMQAYRKTIGDGLITFWKAFNIGLLVLVIASIFYAISWVILYYWVAPDFTTNFTTFYIEQMKAHGSPAKDIAAMQAQFDEARKTPLNPFLNGAVAFTDPLLIGLIITLIFSGIVRKKPPTLELGR